MFNARQSRFAVRRVMLVAVALAIGAAVVSCSNVPQTQDEPSAQREPQAQPPPGQADSAAPELPDPFPVELPSVSLLGARNDLPNESYQEGVSWGELPDNRRWGNTAGIAVGPDNTLWVIDRCGNKGGAGDCRDSTLDPILQFDTSGTFLTAIGAGMFVNPHKLHVDADGNVWVADMAMVEGKGGTVTKLSPENEVLLTLGTPGIAGPGVDTFDRPTDITTAPNGDVFITDGHGQGPTNNARIMKFDRDGNFIKTWGRMGMGPGEFHVPHTIAMDSTGRLFVGDRQNNRIQIFDQDGNFIDQWFQFGRPSGIFIDANDVIYVADSESRDGFARGIPPNAYGHNAGARRGIRIGSARDGSVREFIPDPAPYPYVNGFPNLGDLSGVSSIAEGVAADAEGNVYGAEWLMDVKKYARKE